MELTNGTAAFNVLERHVSTEMAHAENEWEAWLKAHKKELLELDDPKVAARAVAKQSAN